MISCSNLAPEVLIPEIDIALTALYKTNECQIAGHTFDCNPDPTSVFDPSPVVRFGPGPAYDSVPIRFYSRPVRNSLPHPAFNPDFATSHNSDLKEAGTRSTGGTFRNIPLHEAAIDPFPLKWSEALDRCIGICRFNKSRRWDMLRRDQAGAPDQNAFVHVANVFMEAA
ncbi:hypothetical protein EVAR_33824_1 [Eumeta japonica]|uniref:Uncharacterized protein n=1 Tax=Eumeta variegata TaxID=151549 RepID=A0A4C1VA12_EUMVA|nr:hypothetical protein EVAR_33824_1 [Eumeta japonica]